MEDIVTRESLQLMLDKASPEKRQHIVGRALVALFERQTASEKSCNDTHDWNKIGFSGADAKSGTLTAKTYLKHKKLLDWQVERWMAPQKNGYARVTKYAAQLNEIALEKAKEKTNAAQ